MSRDQQGKVFGQSDYNSQNLESESQTGFKTAGQDINNFSNDVGAFKAQNPYVQGGTVQTAQNQQLSDVASGAGASAGQALQSSAVRGGQNAGQSIAATKNIQQENTRALMGDEAAATQGRAAAGTAYTGDVLKGEGEVENMQDQLAQQEGGLGEGYLGIAQKAGETPSFWDTVGSSFGAGLGSTFGKAAGAAGGAALFG
jgi:hypothetical protein